MEGVFLCPPHHHPEWERMRKPADRRHRQERHTVGSQFTWNRYAFLYEGQSDSSRHWWQIGPPAASHGCLCCVYRSTAGISQANKDNAAFSVQRTKAGMLFIVRALSKTRQPRLQGGRIRRREGGVGKRKTRVWRGGGAHQCGEEWPSVGQTLHTLTCQSRGTELAGMVGG